MVGQRMQDQELKGVGATLCCWLLLVLVVLWTLSASNVWGAGRIFTDDQYGVSIETPEGWYQNRGTRPLQLVFFSDVPPSAPDFSDRPRIKLTVKPAQGNVDMEAKSWVAVLEMRLGRPIPHEGDSPRQVVVNGNPGVRLDLKLVSESFQARSISYLFVKQGATYMLSLDIGQDNFDNLDRYVATFEQCVKSLRLEPPGVPPVAVGSHLPDVLGAMGQNLPQDISAWIQETEQRMDRSGKGQTNNLVVVLAHNGQLLQLEGYRTEVTLINLGTGRQMSVQWRAYGANIEIPDIEPGKYQIKIVVDANRDSEVGKNGDFYLLLREVEVLSNVKNTILVKAVHQL